MKDIKKDNNLSNIIMIAESFGRDLYYFRVRNWKELSEVLGIFLSIKCLPSLEAKILENSDFLRTIWPAINEILKEFNEEKEINFNEWQ